MKKILIKNCFKLLALFFVLAPIFISTPSAYGQSYNFKKDSGLDNSAEMAGFETGADAATVEGLTGKVILVVLSMLGVVFMAFVIYGGVVWMTADGNEQKVKTANGIIMNALFGLIIILAAYVISYFLINYFG